jgi:hypothetical protein
LEARRDAYDQVVEKKIPITPDLSVKRELPTLPQGCSFSAIARAELDNMQIAHNLEYTRRLRDDLITKVIPECDRDCNDLVAKAKGKLERDCPGEIAAALLVFNEEVTKKRDKRSSYLKTKNEKLKRKQPSSADKTKRNPPKGKRKRQERQIPGLFSHQEVAHQHGQASFHHHQTPWQCCAPVPQPAYWPAPHARGFRGRGRAGRHR